MNTSEFRSGQTIFTQGDPGDRLYLIVEGTVKVSLRGPAGRTSVRAIIGPTALSDVRALWLDRATVRALMTRQPAIAEQLLRADDPAVAGRRTSTCRTGFQ
ncbi:cyclic nucleotide-binding domain-containing protein [Mycobacterium sp.]|uniref:cyclic nucleotide-binding domain-containing protein n=1 Tax=Mycobacterium sp. TaxID=1785 RepID=UPI0025CFFF59|nr:cyclic nucleotide-binding domain-containing protein [Mycobacterium sp.]